MCVLDAEKTFFEEKNMGQAAPQALPKPLIEEIEQPRSLRRTFQERDLSDHPYVRRQLFLKELRRPKTITALPYWDPFLPTWTLKWYRLQRSRVPYWAREDYKERAEFLNKYAGKIPPIPTVVAERRKRYRSWSKMVQGLAN